MSAALLHWQTSTLTQGRTIWNKTLEQPPAGTSRLTHVHQISSPNVFHVLVCIWGRYLFLTKEKIMVLRVIYYVSP